jgi:hypothetical protein
MFLISEWKKTFKTIDGQGATCDFSAVFAADQQNFKVHPDGSKEWTIPAQQHRSHRSGAPPVTFYANGQEFNPEQWAERKARETQIEVDACVTGIMQGLPERVPVTHPLRFRTRGV